MIRHWLAGAWLAVCVMSCRPSEPEKRTDSAAVSAARDSVPVAVSAPSSLPGVSPHPIQWTAAIAADRLRSMGLSPTVAPESVREPFLQPDGTRLVVRSGVLPVDPNCSRTATLSSVRAKRLAVFQTTMCSLHFPSAVCTVQPARPSVLRTREPLT